MAIEIREIMRLANDKSASDIHISVGSPPILRINGELITQANFEMLTPADTRRLIYSIMDDREKEHFEGKNELDFSYSLPGVGRFRVSVFRQRGSICAVLRIVPQRIPSLAELNLPPILQELTRERRGLLLITGPAGCGKSTTLAAMLDVINSERRYHIMTIEDPIEFIHLNKSSIVHQREVNSDTPSFTSALKHALRQDPDVIFIGEMRDFETISISLQAAESGHLVMATMHTSSAANSLDPIISSFPPHQRTHVQGQLAECLVGVVSQQLVPRMRGGGRIPAVEILIATSAVRNLIREGKIHQLPSVIQLGTKFGMQTMDQSLRELYTKRLIGYEVAISRAFDQESLIKMLGGGRMAMRRTT